MWNRPYENVRDCGPAQARQYRSNLRRLWIVFVSSHKSRPDGWQELVRNSWNGTRADRLWPTVSFDPSAIKIGGPSAVRGRQPWGSHRPSRFSGTRYAACLHSLLFPMVCFDQPMRTRGFETERRPDASGRYACWTAKGFPAVKGE